MSMLIFSAEDEGSMFPYLPTSLHGVAAQKTNIDVHYQFPLALLLLHKTWSRKYCEAILTVNLLQVRYESGPKEQVVHSTIRLLISREKVPQGVTEQHASILWCREQAEPTASYNHNWNNAANLFRPLWIVKNM
jgi:hypothetical protein